MNIKLCSHAWVLLSLSFSRSRCRAVSPPPRRWCLSSTWMNSAPSSYPPCSWPAAVAADTLTSSSPAKSKLWLMVLSVWHLWATWRPHKNIKNIVYRLVISHKHLSWFCRLLLFSFRCYRRSLQYVFSTERGNQSKVSLRSQLSIPVSLLEPERMMKVPAQICWASQQKTESLLFKKNWWDDGAQITNCICVLLCFINSCQQLSLKISSKK